MRFNEGDKVRVTSPYWTDGSHCNESLHIGAVGVVRETRDSDGDIFVLTNVEEQFGGYVAEDNVEPYTEPVIPSIGKAVVDVEVRFLIDGQDVTDRIKQLFN